MRTRDSRLVSIDFDKGASAEALNLFRVRLAELDGSHEDLCPLLHPCPNRGIREREESVLSINNTERPVNQWDSQQSLSIVIRTVTGKHHEDVVRKHKIVVYEQAV